LLFLTSRLFQCALNMEAKFNGAEESAREEGEEE